MGMRQEQEPASTEVVEVAPDILRMQLPISLPGLGHVNTYALCDERGVAVVDPGLPGKASWEALVSRLRQAGYKVSDVHTVIVTHSHPDHFGGAGTLRHEAGAEVITHRSFRTWLDPDEGDDVPGDVPDAVTDGPTGDRGDRPSTPGTAPWQRDKPWGGGKYRPPVRMRAKMKMGRVVGRRWMRAPDPSRRVDDHDVIELAGREWTALHTPGHTHDHLCLASLDDGIVLSGDHVLPSITPHISGLTAGADPLSEFFSSLERMATLEGVSLALPAHGHPFEDLAGRCREIHDHHLERLDVLRGASHQLGDASVVELSHQLFRERSWGPMAESETYAHLEHLRQIGEMTARRQDDQLHYAMSEAAPAATADDAADGSALSEPT